MNPSKFPKNKTAPWRVMIPKKWSPTGKRWPHYFKNEKLATAFCQKVKRFGVSAFDDAERPKGTAPILSEQQEDQFMAAARYGFQKLGEVSILYRAIDHWIATRLNVTQGTIEEVVTAFHEARKRNPKIKSPTVLRADRSRLNSLTSYFAGKELTEITESMLREYFDALAGNHRSIYKTVNLFFGWARERNYLVDNPMKSIKPVGEFGVNNEYYLIEDFRRMLQIAAGLPDPKGEVEITKEYIDLLPWLVLSGFGGFRSCEVARLKDRDALRWTDLCFNANPPGIDVRKAVAKGGRSRPFDKPYAIEAIKVWLDLVESRNEFICALGTQGLGDLKKRFSKATGIKFNDNGLRNSFATYALSYDSREGAGAIAKQMGNSEKVLLSNYARLLATGSGQAWFDLRPQTLFSVVVTEKETEEEAA
jgi:integrase